MEFVPRYNAFSFQIDPSSILIAGGFDDDEFTDLKDCYTLDITTYNLKKVSDLPKELSFNSPSPLIIEHSLYCLGENTKGIIKYSIDDDEWERVHRFR